MYKQTDSRCAATSAFVMFKSLQTSSSKQSSQCTQEHTLSCLVLLTNDLKLCNSKQQGLEQKYITHIAITCCIGSHVAIGNCDRWLIGLRLVPGVERCQPGEDSTRDNQKNYWREAIWEREKSSLSFSLYILSSMLRPHLSSSSSSSSPSSAVSLDAHGLSAHKKASDIIMLLAFSQAKPTHFTFSHFCDAWLTSNSQWRRTTLLDLP